VLNLKWEILRITKEKVRFAKGYEHTFLRQILRVVKVIHRVPQPVYELSDLQDRQIEVQFYNYELVKDTVSPQTEFQIEKIIRVTMVVLNNISSSGEDTMRRSILG